MIKIIDAAENRVRNPKNRPMPPKNSPMATGYPITPIIPIHADSPGPWNVPKSFCEPCAAKIAPAIIRISSSETSTEVRLDDDPEAMIYSSICSIQMIRRQDEKHAENLVAVRVFI